jgi:RNA polymerase sigma factor (sigma-70 family)
MVMPPTPEEFEDLLARARQGDNGAMMQLVELYEPEIRRFAHNKLRDPLRPYLGSMDLVQSVHRSLIGNLRKDKFTIASPKDLIALAVTFAVHKVSHAWRKVQREEKIGRLAARLADRARGEEDPAAVAERQDSVRRFLEQVQARDRRLLELYLEPCSTPEIAARLKLQANVVRVYLSRLFKKLRELGVDPLAAA